MNNFTAIGRLGKDATYDETNGGVTRARFSIAVSRRYKDKDGERVEKTSWIPCSYYGKGAEAVEDYLVKGKQVAITGRIETYSYEKDGEKKSGFECVLNELELLGGGDKKRDADEDDEEEEERPAARRKPSSGGAKRRSSDDGGKAPW